MLVGLSIFEHALIRDVREDVTGCYNDENLTNLLFLTLCTYLNFGISWSSNKVNANAVFISGLPNVRRGLSQLH